MDVQHISPQNYDNNSINFWKNSAKIEQYVNGILKYFNLKKYIVDVEFGKNAKVLTSNNKSEYIEKVFNIILPEIPLVITDSDKKRNLFARSAFLRHEIAHIIYTDFDWFTEAKNNSMNIEAIELLEDMRVEYLYSNKLKGTKRHFKILAFIFYKRDKQIIESKKYNIINLIKYMYYYNIGIKVWDDTPIIKFYEKLRKKFINSLLTDDYKNEFEKFIKNANDEISYQTKNEIIIKLNKENNNSVIFGGGSGINNPNVYQNFNKHLDITNDQNLYENVFGKEFEDAEDIINEFDDYELNLYELNDRAKFVNSMTKNLSSVKIYKDKIDIKPEDVTDAITLNLYSLFKDFNGLGLTNKKGKKIYKEVVFENKKTINESIRFLSLKLQNKTKDRVRKLLLEGDLDQDNIQDILINKENPRSFLKRIKKIDPKTSIYFLMDISESMDFEQIKLCIQNAIILADICDKMKMKYSFNMFTSTSGYSLYAKKRKANLVTLNNVKRIFRGMEKYINVYFRNEEGVSYNLSNLKITTIKNNNEIYKINLNYGVPIIYTIKDIDEKFTDFHKNILGILYNNTKKIKSILSNSTPEFQSLAQIVKNNKKDNSKNKLLFLINDGQFDASFGNNITIENLIAYSYFSFPYNNNGIDLSNLDEIIEYLKYLKSIYDEIGAIELLNKIKNENYWWKPDAIINKTFCDAMFNNIFDTLLFFKKHKNNKEYLYNYINENNLIKQYKYREEYYVSVVEKRYLDYLDKITDFINEYYLNNAIIIYRSLINNLKEQNWNIIGGGIRSNYGKRYLDNFMYFNTASDIQQTFSKQLRDNF